MRYHVTHTTKYSYSAAVPVCHNLVHLAPRSLPQQMCTDRQLIVRPEPSVIQHRVDYFGNHVTYFSIEHAHRGLTISAVSRVDLKAPKVSHVPDLETWERVSNSFRSNETRELLDVFQFVVHSPRITPFAGLEDYTRKSFPAGRPIVQGVEDLTSRIHEDFQYDPQATTVHTPIDVVFKKRHGVCQDFANLEIGCLRSIGLAARYVSGYLRTQPPPGKPRLIGADASHAWLSVYCGQGGWIDFDPTNNVQVAEDHITVAWGRDYSDVCPVQGIIAGGGEHTMKVSVDVTPQDEDPGVR